MTLRATSTFTVDSWDPSPYAAQDGIEFARVHLTKTFSGDLEGTSTVEMLTVSGTLETSRAYVALERIEGRLHGQSGSFVLMHTATATVEGNVARWTIVPDTGTGELRGLRGAAEIVIAPDGGHSLLLEYELAGVPA